MPRALKAFSQVEPRNIQIAAPKSNQFALDLGGLNLTDDQLGQIRHEAVKAAMLAAANLLAAAGRPNLDDFGTFSTFSTFSTFGSGSAFGGRPLEIRPGVSIGSEAKPVIESILKG